MPGVDSSDTVFDFLEHHGSAGAFRDVVQGAVAVINECFQMNLTLTHASHTGARKIVR